MREVETVNEHCKHTDCMYRGKVGTTDTCDYIIYKHQSRGCKISECIRYKRGRKKVNSTLGQVSIAFEVLGDED